jgi:hypothetical protein
MPAATRPAQGCVRVRARIRQPTSPVALGDRAIQPRAIRGRCADEPFDVQPLQHVDRGIRRREAELVADLARGGRHAVLALVRPHVLEHLELAIGRAASRGSLHDRDEALDEPALVAVQRRAELLARRLPPSPRAGTWDGIDIDTHPEPPQCSPFDTQRPKLVAVRALVVHPMDRLRDGPRRLDACTSEAEGVRELVSDALDLVAPADSIRRRIRVVVAREPVTGRASRRIAA